jgi:hypothetical protein
MLRRIFVPKREELKGGWKKFHMKNFITCIPVKILLE